MTCYERSGLPLRELEPLASLRTARLLALDRARVPRQQPEVTQLAPVRLIDLYERARDGEAKRSGLPGRAAALEARADVVAPERVGCRKRLLNRADQRRARKVIAERASVDVPLAGARADVYAAHRFLAAADG